MDTEASQQKTWKEALKKNPGLPAKSAAGLSPHVPRAVRAHHMPKVLRPNRTVWTRNAREPAQKEEAAAEKKEKEVITGAIPGHMLALERTIEFRRASAP